MSDTELRIRHPLESVETTAEELPHTGPAVGELVLEVAACVAELVRVVRHLERLVDMPASEPVPDTDAGGVEDETEFSLFAEESNLTRREAEVLRHLLDGHSNRQISRSMRISESTVKNHMHTIFVKLDARDRTQVVAKVYHLMAANNTATIRAKRSTLSR
jgi:DNA-binding CsgD family transcriptional regulator